MPPPKSVLLALACFLVVGCSAQTNFTLPGLPYSTAGFEPSIDNATMVLHWTRHTQSFATRLNDALLGVCRPLRKLPLYNMVISVGRNRIKNTACETAIRNNAGGLFNHALFFLHNLAPWGTQTFKADASSQLNKAIVSSFGSYSAFQAEFATAATGVFGSGWAWVVYVPAKKGGGRLVITTTPNQDNPLMGVAATRGFPILGLDVWEHAYYLKYQPNRPGYVAAFDSVINWKGVSQVFKLAQQDKYKTFNPLDLKTSIWG